MSNETQLELDAIVPEQPEQADIYSDAPSNPELEKEPPKEVAKEQPEVVEKAEPVKDVKEAPKQVEVAEKALTAKEIAKLAAEAGVAASRQPKPAAKVEQPVNQEEVDKLLRRFKVDKNYLKGLGFEDATDEQIAGFQNFSKQTAEHAFAMAQIAMEHKVQEVLAQHSGLFQDYQQRQAEQVKNGFFGQFPELKQYDRFVQLAAKEISPVKADGSEMSLEEAAQAVATATKQLLQQAGVSVNSQEANHGAVAPTKKVPSMARVESIGRSVASPVSGKQNNPDASIYDDMD